MAINMNSNTRMARLLVRISNIIPMADTKGSLKIARKRDMGSFISIMETDIKDSSRMTS